MGGAGCGGAGGGLGGRVCASRRPCPLGRAADPQRCCSPGREGRREDEAQERTAEGTLGSVSASGGRVSSRGGPGKQGATGTSQGSGRGAGLPEPVGEVGGAGVGGRDCVIGVRWGQAEERQVCVACGDGAHPTATLCRGAGQDREWQIEQRHRVLSKVQWSFRCPGPDKQAWEGRASPVIVAAFPLMPQRNI